MLLPKKKMLEYTYIPAESMACRWYSSRVSLLLRYLSLGSMTRLKRCLNQVTASTRKTPIYKPEKSQGYGAIGSYQLLAFDSGAAYP